RMHAAWTLEGLGAATPETVRAALKDPHPQVRIAAIRISETLFKAGDGTLGHDIRNMISDPDEKVVIQAMMTAKLLKWPDQSKLLADAMASNKSRGVQEIGTQLKKAGAMAPRKVTAEQMASYERGQVIYSSLCFSCHGADGTGTEIPGNQLLAPALKDSEVITGHHGMSVRTLLHGLTGPIDGVSYPGEMISMESNGDQWIADVLSYCRNGFGNTAGFISKEQVAKVRAQTKEREKPWTIEELRAEAPQELANREAWKLSSSHGSKTLDGCVDGKLETSFVTGAPKRKGMWIQVELPEPMLVSGIKLDASPSPKNAPENWQVFVSMDGKEWGLPVAKGKPVAPRQEGDKLIDIKFPEHSARFVRFVQNGHARHHNWSIHELHVLGREPID
ncbi:MAG: discoidin domain-containing protein, partial [Akkermansiaceae bacterium]|nr:discoidin domain-containing protein [Akkermansiaceae bacterium]